MSKFRVLTACILLSGLSLACSGGRIVQAKQDAPQTQRISSVAVRPGGEPLRPEWKAAAPASFKNLTVIPVTSDDYAATDQFITLDQGLQSGTVTITELGADGHTRNLRPGEQADDNAEVNKLSITNRSGKLLVLIAGEILSGGKQDRIVGSDRIVKPDNSPMPLDVFCVEHGRWSGGPAFGQSRVATGSVIADGSSRGRSSSGAAGTVNIVTQSGTAATEADRLGETVTSRSVMALPSIRERAQAKKSQSEVWTKVGETADSAGVSLSTGALAKVYEDKTVTRDLDQYEGALRAEVAGKNVVGVIVVINGRPLSADVFASAALFQSYWPKLLKSYALEAMSQDKTAKKEQDMAAAGLFLSRVEGRSSSEGQDGLYRLTEHQSGDDSSFELEYTAMTPPLLVHFNRVVGR
jgi:hypothetical protein